MKRIISIKPILALITIALFAVVFKGCKKADSNGNEIISPTSQIEKIKKQIREIYGGDVSSVSVIPINKQSEQVFYKNNADGKMHSLYEGRTGSKDNSSNFVDPRCQYNCNNTSNPSDLLIQFNLISEERYYICGNQNAALKSSVLVKWTLAAPFSKFQIPGSGSVTYGKVTFTQTGGSPIDYFALPSDPDAKFQIKYLGSSGLCLSGNSLFEITFKVDNVPDACFQSDWTVSSWLSLDVNCSVVGNVVTSANVNGPSFSQNGYLPCNRIDKIWLTGSRPEVASGNNLGISCTPPAGFIYSDLHQIEYRKVTHSTSFKWDDQTPSSSNGPFWGQISGTNQATFSLNGAIDLPNITPGWWLIRHRNVKIGSCNTISPSPGGFPGAPWGNEALWFTEAKYYL